MVECLYFYFLNYTQSPKAEAGIATLKCTVLSLNNELVKSANAFQEQICTFITIYAPVIYTAPCIGIGIGKCDLGPTDVKSSRAHPPSYCTRPHQNHYAQGRINHRCINSYISW